MRSEGGQKGENRDPNPNLREGGRRREEGWPAGEGGWLRCYGCHSSPHPSLPTHRYHHPEPGVCGYQGGHPLGKEVQ